MEAVVDTGADRRRARRRRSVEEHGIVSARIRPGYEARLIDISAGGALVECVRRMLPGTVIELSLAVDGRSASLRGRVLRCHVVRLKSTLVWYRGAIGFDGDIPWLLDREIAGYAVPLGERPDPGATGEDATQVAR